ncbi:bifunctional tRNA (5-methylaminomethyl-2-thiouridine)(34)-methyltransferase MnmD/FAD-dependent 5-carboxymethylaminomethyl-2-thiouridine(34) oxidoreductase MnmC [Chitinimonas koreensis]|uniref:bifunctional tRNA (5-methylaminomethyl-2-thiouridine)(34)-methyltransferase MnmD/FAD-dependent 5-carboxymethylaminomethyl-2-thiouridine(34) oxidoreductase MnmC n=1 Tax=Chitinimonas koreensis TaxID=356302 RepID=UPI000409D56E|nr:bifunctional tRNA (5-methylaminomethyl-2-thiouridine)(34)-methyltransferase MnmD/FAD-dependent 5-carboxymethylaminomethyl-2-thiouridine(34) oxidoreductase MnmC [Chitinimonas koreensis]
MTPRHPPLQTARLDLTADGIPYSAAFDDVYHTQDGGLAQARDVFMAGNGLPERWGGRANFTICETGFGLGLSFLASWAAWRADPRRSERLHFVSCELHPFAQADLATLHAALFAAEDELAGLGRQLVAQWPLLVPGFHRLEFDGGRVVLTLLLGDALDWLPRLSGQVDAFYLDGFAPAKNPALWQEALFKQFARLAATGATLATYTVAGAVRRGLEAAGFAVEKRPGFGRKRQMLAGAFRGRRTAPTLPPERHALVIGAGLAGAAIAERLATRGWRITLLEREAGPAAAASGNHAGAYRPVLSGDDNLQARLARAAFLYGLRGLARLPDVRWAACGALQLARDDDEAARFAALPDQLGLPTDHARAVDVDEASRLAGQPVAAGGLWFPQAGWINPPSLVAALLAAAAPRLEARLGCTVTELRRDEDGWQAFDASGTLLARAPVAILANAADAARFAPDLLLGRDERLVSHLPAGQAPAVRAVVCRGGYLTPAHAGLACIGSSPAGEAAAGHNLALLDAMLPGAADGLDAATLGGRRCARPGTPDRLPVVGPLADAAAFLPKHAGSLHLAPRRAGLYALTGFGARGLVWSQLCSELLAAQICGEPLPVERELALAVDPARFLARRAC